MTIGTKVTGTYFGVEFSGTISEIWGWTDKCGRDGDDAVFVTLDWPIVVNGVERKMVSVKPQTGTVRAA